MLFLWIQSYETLLKDVISVNTVKYVMKTYKFTDEIIFFSFFQPQCIVWFLRCMLSMILQEENSEICLYLLMPVDFLAFSYYMTQ